VTEHAEVILGLDVGTTAVKVAAFGVHGRSQQSPLPSTQREYRLEQPQPGWQVQDPHAVLTAIDAAVAECVGRLGGARVLALSLSAAQHGLIGLDNRLEPLTPLVTWADSRAVDEARELRAGGRAMDLLERTGTPVHQMSPLVKLVWFARHQPELAASARWWVGLKDYVLQHLTGELVTELSSASATGLLNLQARDWDESALALAGVRHDQLPPVLPTTTVLKLRPELAGGYQLEPGLPVVVGAADGPLGNLGTGAIAPGVAGLSLGTSGAVRMAVPEPRFDPSGRLFCYALTDDLWVTGGAVSNCGIALRWAGETFAPDLVSGGHADAELLALAQQAPVGSDGLVLLPYILSERAPLGDVAGALLGIRSHHTSRHFLRAAVEGVCLQMSTIVNALDTVAPVTTVRATGGPFRSNLWAHVMAATLDRPLVIQTDAGGTALGAAALGWFALGGAETLPEALTAVGGPGQDNGHPPVPVTAEEVAGYARLRASVPALIAAYAEVAELFVPPSPSRAQT